MRDDIPEAIRHSVSDTTRPTFPITAMVVGGVLLAAIALGTILLLRPKDRPITQPPVAKPSIAAATPSSAPSIQTSASQSDSPDRLLGHLTYKEAPLNELDTITSDGQIKLRLAAAQSYRKMAAAAESDGVKLVPISGFRSKADQNDLFFRVKEQRNQDVSKRAEVSAPPGHSEHHTGYATDISDANHPEANLNPSFENTPAFQWLSSHAAQYSFELSFTKGNAQGVSYEPWHWRFVGDEDSLETFYRAQHLNKSP
jgi:zinc D-Ala-D-Ala carboxypeptidase